MPKTTEEVYRKAPNITQEQEAKLRELRGAVSLARLRRDQGHHAEAHELLAPVYGWFHRGGRNRKRPRRRSTSWRELLRRVVRMTAPR
jgi:hypothetical protein